MKYNENMLFKYGDGKVIRVLYINRVSSIIYVIDMASNRWANPLRINELQLLQEQTEIILLEEDTYCRVVFEEELSEAEKRKREQAWEIVKYLLNNVETVEHLYISKYREKAIKEAMAIFKLSYNGVKNLLIRYWHGAQTKDSLLPNYHRCGAKHKDRKCGNKKRGKPRNDEKGTGVNVDDNMKKIFKVALNRYYYSERNNSLKITYELMLRDSFVKEQVEQNGIKFPLLLEKSQLPSYQQFLYWFKKLNNAKVEISQRSGTRAYQQNFRTIIGDSTQDAGGACGSLWQIDSTVFDIYLVGSVNRDLIVGRPILHMVIDVYSRLIMGFNVSFESLNSYSGAMVALANSMSSKKEYASKYGVNIEDEEWPYCVPLRVMADRGELVGKQIENAIQGLGITIQNSPPYHADYKGIIESAFSVMNSRVKPFADGVVIKGKGNKERGEADYRLKANLSIDDFITIIIKCVLFHNKNHVLTDYVLDELMIEEKIEKIPIQIWNHGLKHRKGQLRILPEEMIKTHLLPMDKALVSARGVSYKKMLYASEYTLKNEWFQKARIHGSWKVNICYDPRDLTNIYVMDEGEQGLLKLTLLEHLMKYANKGIEEIEQMTKHEQQNDEKSKEKELQEKIQLFTEIEHIVESAKRKTDSERDYGKSKTQRLAGIKENQRNERLLHRATEFKETFIVETPTVHTEKPDDETDDLHMFFNNDNNGEYDEE
ncbi:Mu transposase C-terminal domain-containing protein [Paenibacillus vini]|uniref:Integrase catalytic domain-containing protein n=1 Tax=Paenibacillus vini TaxID=1476024 RepID=A0ABQ4MAF9_9BACL|nr:Mu transposase C-terminal domain-containing protein [Paenibacillus vini]GIP52957.1 hypothetical protein J42TS3_19920 [Paenibacillus vini]